LPKYVAEAAIDHPEATSEALVAVWAGSAVTGGTSQQGVALAESPAHRAARHCPELAPPRAAVVLVAQFNQQGHKPRVTVETIALIMCMVRENRLWGTEHIRGELLKLNIKRTIHKYIRQLHVLFISELATRRVVHVGVARYLMDEWVASSYAKAFCLVSTRGASSETMMVSLACISLEFCSHWLLAVTLIMYSLRFPTLQTRLLQNRVLWIQLTDFGFKLSNTGAV
jgi:hypothetical protein